MVNSRRTQRSTYSVVSELPRSPTNTANGEQLCQVAERRVVAAGCQRDLLDAGEESLRAVVDQAACAPEGEHFRNGEEFQCRREATAITQDPRGGF